MRRLIQACIPGIVALVFLTWQPARDLVVSGKDALMNGVAVVTGKAATGFRWARFGPLSAALTLADIAIRQLTIRLLRKNMDGTRDGMIELLTIGL